MNRSILAKNPLNRVAGSSLLEVLVTVVLLSIGLLGIAGTQAIGLKNVANASLRTQSSVLAYDIVDRMRANALKVNDYRIAFGTAASTNPTTIAEKDQFWWKNSVASNLPQGDGAVIVAGDVVTVRLQWIEREGASGLMHTFQFSTRL